MKHHRLLMFAAALFMGVVDTRAASEDTDALALESAPSLAEAPLSEGLRLFVEGTVGRIAQRYGLPDIESRRLSLDLNWSTKLSEKWKASISNRLDEIHPSSGDLPSTINSLREAYASWNDELGQRYVEFGRINVRNGPSYGFNPTDYFRDGALRAVTTADPFALRENRLGTVLARYQDLWAGGGISLAFAPKLADAPSNESFSLDLGSTNNRNRGLATWSASASDRLSGQLLGYVEDGKGPQLGVSFTALLSDSAVGHAEVSRGLDDDLFSAAVIGTARQITRNRISVGGTYTIARRGLALTAEYEYNGFAPDRAAWYAGAAAGPRAYGDYLLASQARQDIASRTAWLLYVSQKNAVWKGLDLTALLRINGEDQSRFAWLEMRYHWPSFDTALQWQSSIGESGTEYGIVPYRQSLQLLGAWYF